MKLLTNMVIKMKLRVKSNKLYAHETRITLTWVTCSPLSVTILIEPSDLWRRLSSCSEARLASMSLSISTTIFKFLYPFSGIHLIWGATSTMTSYLEHKSISNHDQWNCMLSHSLFTFIILLNIYVCACACVHVRVRVCVYTSPFKIQWKKMVRTCKWNVAYKMYTQQT